MSKIFRYELNITDYQKVKLPSISTPLSVAASRTNPYEKIDFWAIVNDGDPRPDREHEVFIAGTGFPVPAGINVTHKFVGTVISPNNLVWHVFVGR